MKQGFRHGPPGASDGPFYRAHKLARLAMREPRGEPPEVFELLPLISVPQTALRE